MVTVIPVLVDTLEIVLKAWKEEELEIGAIIKTNQFCWDWPVKDHQLILVLKTHKEKSNNKIIYLQGKRTCHLVGFAFPADDKIKIKVIEKIIK